jgi:glucan phosphorylase
MPPCEKLSTLIASGALGSGDVELFRPIVDNFLNHDPFFLLSDYQAYIDVQERVSALWRDPTIWTRQSILNVARMGSSPLIGQSANIANVCGTWNLGKTREVSGSSLRHRISSAQLEQRKIMERVRARMKPSRASALVL